MDILVRYWDINEKKVLVRYWDSKFLGHTRHTDLMKAFNDGLEGLDQTKLIQISMDGTNTNLKFLSEMKIEREKNEQSKLIDIGSCSLHSIHGAFKSGSEKSGWDLHKILKGSFTLLHDSPARREDYFNITGSVDYPLQFCGTRCVEEKKVAEKLIKLWPNMVKLYDFWSSLAKSKRPDSKSYENVKKGIDDPLTVAKLHFFSYIAGLLQPFLTAFQGDGPMLPFLCNDIKTIFVSLLGLILKPQVFEKTQTSELTKVAEDDINLMKTKCIHLGFAAETEIQNLFQSKKVTAEQVLQMRGEALDFIRTTISKLSQRNPMMSAIVRSGEALDPQIMVNRGPEELKRKVRNLIQKFVNLKIVPFKTGDEAPDKSFYVTKSPIPETNSLPSKGLIAAWMISTLKT